jgi:acetyl coenzyme A synthetase (ADP forming)-like protein
MASGDATASAPRATGQAGSLDRFFAPASVAIIGASTQEGSVGHSIVHNMLSSGFQGAVYPVNPKATELLGVRCYPNVAAIEGEVDLAIIVVPARIVNTVLDECGQKGIEATIIISAGFKETGHEGAELERELAATARRHGIRVVGPNCLGIMVPAVGLNASFATDMPQDGVVAMMSQSGALATAILDWSFQEGLGFSRFVSFGNAMDVGAIDLLLAWKDDPATRVILAYLEGVQDGPEFMHVAYDVSRVKPLIIVKSGATSAGARAVSSHTGSLAGSEQAYEAAFRQAGIIRADSVEQLYDYAMSFSCMPPPKGRGIAILTNAGGPGIMATDAAERAGLRLASLERTTVEALREALPPAANVYNPVDVLGDSAADRYQRAGAIVSADANVNMVLALVTPQAMTDIPGTARAIHGIAKGSDKVLVGCLMGGREMSAGQDILNELAIPVYGFPERAVGALAAMARYAEWLQLPDDTARVFEVDDDKVTEVITRVRAEGRLNLGETEAREICTAYGFRVPHGGLATGVEDAAHLAEEIGFPVVMKIASPDILHKSDIGGVRVGLSSTEAVVDSFELMTMRARRYVPDAMIWGVQIQEMVQGGREVIMGMSRDPQFGPLVMFGLGGIYVEVLKDVAFRIAPFGEYQARTLVEEIRGYPLLAGTRGEKPADLEALVEALLRLSQLVTQHPDILEMDVNPLNVGEVGGGTVAIDARITVAEQPPSG